MRVLGMALAVAAAFAAGPAMAYRGASSFDPRVFLTDIQGGGKGKRKHRMSRPPRARMPGNTSSHIAHQGRQERLRRLIGGFYVGHRFGMTKAMVIARIEKAAARGAPIEQVREEVFA